MKEDLKKHLAGATVTHRGTFDSLESYTNETEMTQAFRQEWVVPFYWNLRKVEEEWVKQIVELKPMITEEIILKNLGDFNWRTRSTGAFFAAVKGKVEFIDIIGTHLLKSEVCCVGQQYARTLASFNTPKAVEYLNEYLSYYLLQKSLDFDQVPVMAALKYLDLKNGTNEVDKHLENWKAYNNGSSEIDIKHFTEIVSVIDKIRNS